MKRRPGWTVARSLRLRAARRKRMRALHPVRRLEMQVEAFERRIDELLALSRHLAN